MSCRWFVLGLPKNGCNVQGLHGSPVIREHDCTVWKSQFIKRLRQALQPHILEGFAASCVWPWPYCYNQAGGVQHFCLQELYKAVAFDTNLVSTKVCSLWACAMRHFAAGRLQSLLFYPKIFVTAGWSIGTTGSTACDELGRKAVAVDVSACFVRTLVPPPWQFKLFFPAPSPKWVKFCQIELLFNRPAILFARSNGV